MIAFSCCLGLYYYDAYTANALDDDAQTYKNIEGNIHDEHDYLDAFSSFSDLPNIHILAENGSSSNKTKSEIPLESRAFADDKDSFAPKQMGFFDTSEGSKSFIGAHVSSQEELKDSTKEPKNDATKKDREEKGGSKVISIILNCLESLPILPASAADMSSSKLSVSVGSISVMASTVDVRAVTVKCACVDKSNSNKKVSSCVVPCSFPTHNGSSFQSLSYRESSKVKSPEAIGIFSIVFFGVVWLLFWFLVAGGFWKLFGGVYRFYLSI